MLEGIFHYEPFGLLLSRLSAGTSVTVWHNLCYDSVQSGEPQLADNKHRSKPPENPATIALSGQNGTLINGSSGSALLRLMNGGVTGTESTPGPSGSAALCLITQEWTRRKSLPTKNHVGRDFRRSPRRSAACSSMTPKE